MIVLRSGTVLTAGGWKVCDLWVDEVGVISLGDEVVHPEVTEIDVEGCLVGPSFVDLHCHLREPGETWKEDIESASRAAAAGGFGAVVAMPNTRPAADRPDRVAAVRERGEQVGLVDVVPAGALTEGRAGDRLADLEGLHRAGVRLFTDDGDAVADEELLERAMRVLALLPGAVLAQHAEEPSLSRGAHIHEGALSRSLGLPGIPAAAETAVVARDLRLVETTGARYHCQHVSSHLTVELLAQAKERGLPVTAEVTPHHLALDDSQIPGLDPNFKMYPPLRSPSDREALVAALRAGIIDAVATDHAPHSRVEKSVGFESAPRGVIGLETAAAVTWESTGGDRDLLFRTLSTGPAGISGMEAHGRPLATGAPANIVAFDPEVSWVVEDLESRSDNSPFLGRTLRGRVRATIHRGRPVYLLGTVPS